MAEDDDKKKDSDLSDLKARLGLEDREEGESDKKVPQKGPPSSESTSSKGPPSPKAPSSSEGPPSSKGPPAPPPEGGASESGDPSSPSGAEPQSPEAPETDADGSEPEFEWDDDEGFDALDVSTPVWIGAAVVLLVGFLAGYLYSTSSHQRSLYRAQTNQAQSIMEALSPRVEAYQEVRSIIQSMDPENVEFEKVQSLADATMGVDASLLGRSDRLLIGGRRTSMLTTFMVNMQRLNDLINNHRRLTLDEERDQLEDLMAATEADGSNAAGEGTEGEGGEDAGPQYAMLFDFEYLKRQGNSQSFRHRNGVLGTVENLDEPDNGEVTFHPRSTGDPRQVPVQWVVPLTRSELLNVKGQTAFERYRGRVGELKYQIEQMGQAPSTLKNKVSELADRPSPPLIQL